MLSTPAFLLVLSSTSCVAQVGAYRVNKAEVSTAVDSEEAVSKEPLFKEFFADPSSWKKPGLVPSDKSITGGNALSLGSMFGAGGATDSGGPWFFSLGNGQHSFFGDATGGPNEVKGYSFDNDANMMLTWSNEGVKYGKTSDYSPIFGGFGDRSVLIKSGFPTEGRGYWRVPKSASVGSSNEEVYQAMCGADKSGKSSRKYALPLEWDSDQEETWIASPVSKNEQGTTRKLKPYQRALLVLKYNCLENSEESLYAFKSVSIYLSKIAAARQKKDIDVDAHVRDLMQSYW